MTARAIIDPALFEVAREALARVEQTPSRPRLGDWWQEVLARVFAFIAGLLNLDSETVRTLMSALAWAIVVVAGLALLRFAWVITRSRRQADSSAVPVVRRVAEETAVDWAMRLRESLAAGNVSAAIEALWHVLAGRLLGEADAPLVFSVAAQHSWTGRQLLREAGDRRDALRPLLRRLERATYGQSSVSVEEVAGLAEGLEAALGGPSSR